MTEQLVKQSEPEIRKIWARLYGRNHDYTVDPTPRHHALKFELMEMITDVNGFELFTAKCLDDNSYYIVRTSADGFDAIEIRNTRLLHYTAKDPDEIILKWTSEEVMHTAKENNQVITLEEARQVLQMLEKRYDCNNGITWQDLENNINDLIRGRE